MTESEKINILKAMSGGKDTDEILSTFLSIAKNKILNHAFPYDDSVEEVPSKWAMIQCEIACYLLNKRGAEGQTAHSENGITRSYENADIPQSMLRQITVHCGVIK